MAGIAFGGLDVLLMLPMSFPDKRTALLGAFFSRFAIGFVIGCVQLPWPGWLIGIVFGSLISLPDAIITKVVGARKASCWLRPRSFAQAFGVRCVFAPLLAGRGAEIGSALTENRREDASHSKAAQKRKRRLEMRAFPRASQSEASTGAFCGAVFVR